MNPLANLTIEHLAGGNQNHYANLWRKYADLAQQKVAGPMGAALLKTSGLPEGILKDIWDLSDYTKAGALDQKGFFLALHLVALGQGNKVPVVSNVSPQTAPPRFADLSDNMPPGDWAESERKFQELPLQEGFLSGNSVKPMMLSSGLPPATLARIWQMVDTDSDGKLRVNEFCVALFLIKQCSGGQLLPQNLPSSLFIRPSALPSGPALPRRPEEFSLSQAARKKYEDTYRQYAKAGDLITGQEAREVFRLSKLPVATLADIWNLCSKKKAGFLTLEEFMLSMHLIEGKMQGRDIPTTVSPDFRLVTPGGAGSLSGVPSPLGPNDYSCIKELDTFENEVKDMDQQVDSLHQEVAATQSAVAKKSAELTDIQGKLTSATGQRMQLEKMRADLSSRLDEVDQGQVSLNRSLSEVQERCRHEEEEIKGLERELLERETTFKAKQEQLGEMRRHISSLKEQQGEMERQVEERKFKIAEINQSMEEAQRELAREHAKLKPLQEEEGSLSAQMKQLVILEAQTRDADGQIVNLGERDTLPVDYVTKEGDLNSVRATAGSSPVSSISNVSAGSAPQLDEHQLDEDFNPRPPRPNNGGLKGTADRTVKFADEVDQTPRPEPQGAPSGVDPFKSDLFSEGTGGNPVGDPFLTMDPFSAEGQTSLFDPFSSGPDKTAFPGGINPFVSLEAIPPTQETSQFLSDPFNQDPFQDAANTDPFGQDKPGFDTSDPFGAPPAPPSVDPFNDVGSGFNQTSDPFESDPFAGPQGTDPFSTDPFTT